MNRDDEIYAIAEVDQRHFFPGEHAGRALALQALLAPGCSAQWNERGDEVRSRGFVTVKDGSGNVVAESDLARVLEVANASDAWDVLTSAIDPSFLSGLSGRLVDVGADHALVTIDAPRTIVSAVALAGAPREMRAAEELVKDAYSRAAPFGVAPCPPISWRSISRRDLTFETCSRRAFGAVDGAGVDLFGHGAWMELSHVAAKVFSFSSYRTDIPGLLRWPAADYCSAVQFDTARAQRLTTKSGLALADLDNPFEPLLRVALFGLGVKEASAARVVLVCAES